MIYGFLGGLYVGRFTNMVSNVVITGMTLYFYIPEFYTHSNFMNMKNITIDLIKTLGQ